MPYRKLWIGFGIVVGLSFLVLTVVGLRAVKSGPPIPQKVVVDGGPTLFDGATIQQGQWAWQSIGGQEIGTVWGHGSYIAPDWSADWLHREATFMLDKWAQEAGTGSYDALNVEQKASLQARLQQELRTNTYDAATRAVTVSALRAEAFTAVSKHYDDVFSNGRKEYAIPAGALTDPNKLHALNSFFWWTAWAASTDRPNEAVTYTNNWPHEPLVGNNPTGRTIVWSVISFFFLLAGVGGMVWYFGSQDRRRKSP